MRATYPAVKLWTTRVETGAYDEPSLSKCSYLWPAERLERVIADSVTTLERSAVERIAAAVRSYQKEGAGS
jgi:hypothetical protein